MICITEIVICDKDTIVAKLTDDAEGVVSVTIADKPFDLESWRAFAQEVDTAIQHIGELK